MKDLLYHAITECHSQRKKQANKFEALKQFRATANPYPQIRKVPSAMAGYSIVAFELEHAHLWAC